jgi:hypothetical protein
MDAYAYRHMTPEEQELEIIRHQCHLADHAQTLLARIDQDWRAAREYRLTVELIRALKAALRIPEETTDGHKRPQRRPDRGPYSVTDVGV